MVTMWAPFAAEGLQRALEGQVDRFGGAAGEDDLAGGRARQPGHPFAGHLHGLFRLPPEAVCAAGGVPEARAEVGKHGLQDPGVHGRSGVIVQVNRLPHP